jgi:hypothetical protein
MAEKNPLKVRKTTRKKTGIMAVGLRLPAMRGTSKSKLVRVRSLEGTKVKT